MTRQQVAGTLALAACAAALGVAAQTPCWPVADTGRCADPVATAYGPETPPASTALLAACWPLIDHQDCAQAEGEGSGVAVPPVEVDEITWLRRASD